MGLKEISSPLAVNSCSSNCSHNMSGCSASPYMVMITCSAKGCQCDCERSDSPVDYTIITSSLHHYCIIPDTSKSVNLEKIT